MAYAREVAALSPSFAVFPSTEAVLLDARAGAFAGCISATANLNADLCARAWRSGDAGALDDAVTIRKLFDGKQLVSGREGAARPYPRRSGLGAGAAAAQRLRGRRPGGGDVRLRPGPPASPADARPLIGPGRPPPPALTCGEAGDYKLPALAARFSPPLVFATSHHAGQIRGLPAARRTRTGMANTTSAQKATRVIARRTEVNKARRSRMRNSVRKVEEAIASGDRSQGARGLEGGGTDHQRSAQKGIVHRNAASRKVSRLTKRVAQARQITQFSISH